ncbi:MAG: thermonuclease family protein [Candidatus Electrothrix sp. ATG2]|nr:thermonuclease family protein [Candidatus Electrothrix sp. ATG2]
MMHNKTLSIVCVLLLLFSAQNAFSISVEPKSKRALRSSVKKISESRKKLDSLEGKRSRSSSSGKKEKSHSGKSGSASAAEERNRILYTLPEPKDPQSAIMVDVEDGDTIRVLLNDSPFIVTLYGIDSPERTQPHGMKAVQVITKLINRKKVNLLIYDKDGKSRRCLAVVSVGKKNVNELLVKGGHAWVKKEHCYESFCADWLSSQKKAQRAKKGLWAYPDPIAPWVWRSPGRKHAFQQGYSPVANGLRSRYGKDTTIIGR